MKQKTYSEMSLEELKKNEKGLKTATIVMAACVGLMCISGTYLTIKKGFSVSTIMPVVFLPILAINYSMLKKIRAEIATRK